MASIITHSALTTHPATSHGTRVTSYRATAPLTPLASDHAYSRLRWLTLTFLFVCFQLSDQLKTVLVKIPVALQEAVVRLLNRDPRQRPTAQLLSLIKYFRWVSPPPSAVTFRRVISGQTQRDLQNSAPTSSTQALPIDLQLVRYTSIDFLGVSRLSNSKSNLN